MIREIY